MVLVGCGWAGVEGSGTAKREVRPVAGFHAIDISGAITTEIAIAADPRVEISGDDNLIPLVTTLVDGKGLEIGTRKNLRPTLPLVAHVSAPRIDTVEVSGSSHVAIHGVHDDSLTLELSGSVAVHGDGTVRQLKIDVSGSGSVELDQLAAERVSVTITGSGNIVVAASQALDVHITGSGTITYRGDPAITQDITGSGRLIKR